MDANRVMVAGCTSYLVAEEYGPVIWSCLCPGVWEMVASTMRANIMEESPESSSLKSRLPKLSSSSSLQSLEDCCSIWRISCVFSREALKCYQGLCENPEYASGRLAYMLVPSVRCMKERRYSAFLWMDGSRTFSTVRDVTRCFDSAGWCAPQSIIRVDDSLRKGASTSLLTPLFKD